MRTCMTTTYHPLQRCITHAYTYAGISVARRCFLLQDVPQQMNGSDCGVFTCKYAEYLSRDAPFTFTQVMISTHCTLYLVAYYLSFYFVYFNCRNTCPISEGGWSMKFCPSHCYNIHSYIKRLAHLYVNSLNAQVCKSSI